MEGVFGSLFSLAVDRDVPRDALCLSVEHVSIIIYRTCRQEAFGPSTRVQSQPCNFLPSSVFYPSSLPEWL